MKNKIKIPELLAPVGSIEHLKIAIFAGASSIYLSGKKFGARKYAENFTLSQIKEAVDFAHLYNVKVYVTVNTLIKNEEIAKITSYLVDLYKIGVDAVLIQDIGLLKIINKFIPQLTIHASTQMNIQNIEGLKWAKKHNIKRVVLPRELKIAEIKELVNFGHEHNIEIEIFAHGAICYSYSGKCLFSSMVGEKGKRSGNRGACAQPCRQKYQIAIEDQKGEKIAIKNQYYENYLLSPKDLSLYEDLEELSELGIDCIKIEGRMRSTDYVAIVVNNYRQKLNRLKRRKTLNPKKQSKQSPKYDKKYDKNKKGKKEKKNKTNESSESNENNKNNEKDEQSLEELKLVFNRGFTSGHLFKSNQSHSNLMNIMSRKKPGHQGLFIGKIKNFSKDTNEIAIELDKNIITIPEKGDGLLIENKENSYGLDISTIPKLKEDSKNPKNRTLTIKKVKENKKVPFEITKNSKVYLTKRKKISEKTKAILNNKKDQSYKKTVVSLKFHLDSENHPILEVNGRIINGKQIKVQQKGKDHWEIAKNKPITKEQLKKQLLKIGDLPFFIDDIEIRYNENLFSPIGQINSLRRKLFKKLESEIINSYKPNSQDLKHIKENLNNFKKRYVQNPPKNNHYNYQDNNQHNNHYNNLNNNNNNNNNSNTNTSNININRNSNSINNNNNTATNTNTANTNTKKYPLSIYLNDLKLLKSINNDKNIDNENKKNMYERAYLEIPPKESKVAVTNKIKRKSNKPSDFDISYYVNFLKEAIAISKNQDYELVWKWPDIIHKDTLNGLIKVLGILKKLELEINIMNGVLGIDSYLKENYNVKVYGSSSLNIFNTESILNLDDSDLITLSPELSKKDLESIVNSYSENINSKNVKYNNNVSNASNATENHYTTTNHDKKDLEIVIGGNIESIITRNPLISNKIKKDDKKIVDKIYNENNYSNSGNYYLNDFKGNYYPIKEIDQGNSQNNIYLILHNEYLHLKKNISYLKEFAFVSFAIDMRWKSKEEIKSIEKNIMKLFN